MLEEKKVTVDLLYVPEAMPDPELVKILSNFGKISEGDAIIHCKNKYGLKNLQRKIVFDQLIYDIPSFLRVKGYQIGVRYHEQPKTCRLCGEKTHEAKECSLNTSNNQLIEQEQAPASRI